jgi:hypothetical protein
MAAAKSDKWQVLPTPNAFKQLSISTDGAPSVRPEFKFPAVEAGRENKLSETKALVGRGLRGISRGRRGRMGVRKGGNKGGAKRGLVARLPPNLKTVVTCHHIFRFGCTATKSEYTVSWGNLVGALGVVGTVTNSTVVALASSIRLHSLHIWNGISATNALRSEVVWATPSGGVFTKDDSTMESVPTGVTQDTVAVFRPPRNSVWSDWFSAGTVGSASSVIFTITVPVGSIIDMSVSWTMANNIGATSISGLTTVTLGSVYWLALDGTTAQMPPLGVPTTS